MDFSQLQREPMKTKVVAAHSPKKENALISVQMFLEILSE